MFDEGIMIVECEQWTVVRCDDFCVVYCHTFSWTTCFLGPVDGAQHIGNISSIFIDCWTTQRRGEVIAMVVAIGRRKMWMAWK